MTSFKILSITIAILTIFVNTADPFDGCVAAERGRCVGCYERNLLPKLAGCGPKQPANDTCEIYTVEFEKKQIESRCRVCKLGYAIQTSGTPGKQGDLQYKCVKATLQNCIIEKVDTQGYHTCTSCANGLYAVPDESGNSFTCKKISSPIANCKLGGIAIGGSARCSRCNDGFAVARGGVGCEKPNQVGCWINNFGNACEVCDPYQGYSMNKNGDCVKFNSKKGFLVIE